MSNHAESINILLVEDNAGDIVLVREALKSAKIYNQLHVCEDGEKAIQYLQRVAEKDPSTQRPGLVLLDLNLPKKDGREVLGEIKQDEDLRSIPVVVMTTSKNEEDIWRAYDLQANCYITKPVDFNQLMNVVKAIESFWLTLVQLPPAR